MFSLSFTPIPRDTNDPRFAHSFCCSDEKESMLNFFNTYGFIVIGGIFDQGECAATRLAMWQMIELANPGFSRFDIATFCVWKAGGSNIQYHA
jgi:hypothetical protein